MADVSKAREEIEVQVKEKTKEIEDLTQGRYERIVNKAIKDYTKRQKLEEDELKVIKTLLRVKWYEFGI